LVQRGQRDHTDRRAVLVLDRYQGREQGHTVGERLRAIDGVDDPAPATRAVLIAFLLADDRVFGIHVRKARADEALGGAVRFRHRRSVSFAIDDEIVGPEPTECVVARLAGQRDSLVEQLLVDGWTGRSGHGAILASASIWKRSCRARRTRHSDERGPTWPLMESSSPASKVCATRSSATSKSTVMSALGSACTSRAERSSISGAAWPIR